MQVMSKLYRISCTIGASHRALPLRVSSVVFVVTASASDGKERPRSRVYLRNSF